MSEDDSVKHEGKWTRADLPSVIKSHAYAGKYFTRLQELEEYMDTMLDHLNTHYPKPAHRLLSSAAECVLGAEDRVRSAKAERGAAVARAEAAEKRHTWPKTTPTGHTYIAPDTYVALCHQHGNAAQAAIESWEADECPPEPTWEMVGIAHREVERIRCDMDEWKARADQLRDERDDAVADLLDAGRVRDEWEARAGQAEQLIPAYAMLDVWMALGRDSIHFDDWYDERGYADAWAELTAAVREGRGDLDAARENAEHYQAMFDATERQRDEWKARAEALEAEAEEAFEQGATWHKEQSVPAVSRAEQLEKNLAKVMSDYQDLEDEREEIADQFATFRAEIVAEAVKARESAVPRTDIEEQLRIAYESGNRPIERIRIATDAMCDLFSVEAEQATDPVEEKARELYRAATPDARWETVADEYRRIAAYVLGQEASSDE